MREFYICSVIYSKNKLVYLKKERAGKYYYFQPFSIFVRLKPFILSNYKP